MKKIRNFIKQQIHLENFGVIEISKDFDGKWKIDLFPAGFYNNEENLLLETAFKNNGNKYFRDIKSIKKVLGIG
jgi:hypothetical protein